jgi:anthranilate phosphoribosyltransferase
MARCLGRLGAKRAWVVHGAGLDELSLAAETEVAVLENGSVRSMRVTPEDAGLGRSAVSDIQGGNAAQNAQITREVLGGAQGPRADVVVLNAAAALMAAGRANDLREAAGRARKALGDGSAASLLERAREASVRG